AAADHGQAARPAGVVQGPAALGHVGDAVLELDEHVGAVVEAQAVTGAQVLVDPHPHGDGTVPAPRPAPAPVRPVAALSLGSPTRWHPVSVDRVRPPSAPRRSCIRELHGLRWNDDWAWLADRDDPAVLAYLEAENAWAEHVLAASARR